MAPHTRLTAQVYAVDLETLLRTVSEDFTDGFMSVHVTDAMDAASATQPDVLRRAAEELRSTSEMLHTEALVCAALQRAVHVQGAVAARTVRRIALCVLTW